MKVLTIGDIHLKKSVDDTPLLNGIYTFVEEKNPDLVVFMGDTLDTHERIDLGCLVRANKFFKDLSKISEVVVIIGNHDRLNNSDFMSDYHPFVGLENEKNITVVSKTKVIHDMIFVPYVPPGRFREALKDVKDWESYEYIFAHQEFKGAKMGAIISEHGDEWDKSLPKVLSGHIHDFQKLENIYYIGTPVQHKYGESDNKKVLMLDTLSGKMTRHRIPGLKKLRNIHITHEQLLDLEKDKVTFEKYTDPKYKTKLIITVDSSKKNTLVKLPIYNKICEALDKVMIRIENPAYDRKISGENINLWELTKEKLNKEQIKIFNELLK